MSIEVCRPGMLTTIQATPRRGMRHLGVPDAGPADPLSFALANRLVGNDVFAAGLEITLAGPKLGFTASAWIALTGAPVEVGLNGESVPPHAPVRVAAGDELDIGPVRSGVRAYLAIAGGLAAPEVLGSASTYLPAGLGGLDGRALEAGDRLDFARSAELVDPLETPPEYRPPVSSAWAVRACTAAENALVDAAVRDLLFDTNWIVGKRSDRMGIRLEGETLAVASDGRMPSSAVFPGTVQCPGSGAPYLLSVDAQTTGGYPRVLQVARLDRHLLGQLRPGDHLRFVPRTPAQAIAELRAKHDFWRSWLPDVSRVI
jgi:allophanate hydrolase